MYNFNLFFSSKNSIFNNISLFILYIPEYLLVINEDRRGIIELKNPKYIFIKKDNDIVIYNKYRFYIYNKYKRLE